jgi:hypothetical protein
LGVVAHKQQAEELVFFSAPNDPQSCDHSSCGPEPKPILGLDYADVFVAEDLSYLTSKVAVGACRWGVVPPL